jgi:hypothetical protein
MKTKSTFRIMKIAVIAVALFITSCASTRVTSDWKDESYQKKPEKVVVMALLNEAAERRLMEDEFVGALNAAGINALPGYAVLTEGKPDKEIVAAKVRELGADTLLMTKLVDRKTERNYVPGTPYLPPASYYDWYGYYGGFYPPPPGYYPGYPPGYYPPGYSPGYLVERVYDVAEANLYDVKTGKLVWSAVTENEIRGNDRKAIKSYVSEILKSLRKKNLVR